eukprot:Protomagalhaensia_wolfi_Nauph_80__5919@NODE_778_length_2010_cov_41_749366_g586_i0_p1_GENE_NODE_778_length_2010_cov_41_749366_g586_i0NODE_778_length_2010_cov_41_749366_g586_i0_p1_ORF_typecomplete_len483_score90_96SHMT/PF00464_19/2_1e167Aminotran_5/PF00266_19/9_4e13Aminotran_1_2/PF00155_21/1_1e09OKR_DC_1/PF01276_20/0_00017Beta_elim_lyase/PF01212_21/0_0037DegT_DnrJ_EryC1/PF01041_17/0_093_NODE_778_length_2010_cov_41_749366_g586_i01621610
MALISKGCQQNLRVPLTRSIGSKAAAHTLTTNTINSPLKNFDPVLYETISREKKRQAQTIDLIASENYIPRYCSEALASCLSSRYSEGLPGHRYYAGNEIIDEVEQMCIDRARKAFRLDENIWGVNVQILSGSPSNFAVFNGVLNPGDRILFLDLPHGGHLSHGYQTPTKKLTVGSKYFSCLPYRLDPKTELIDYDEIQMLADRFKPNLVIAGYSAYPRLLDYARFRAIADNCGALLLSDIAHIAGLMAGDVIPSAFDYSDIVTTTTHKTLRGPRGALIFMRRDKKTGSGENLESAINSSVFPACQGGPHNHTIAGVAAAMKAASEPEFKQYQSQVLKNAKALGERLQKHSFDLVTNGTDNHLLLVNLTRKGVSGKKVEKAMELCNIICNKNTVLSDKSAANPSGIRLGSPAMTARGFDEAMFTKVADLINEIVMVSKSVKRKMTYDDFVEEMSRHEGLWEIKKTVLDLLKDYPGIISTLWE